MILVCYVHFGYEHARVSVVCAQWGGGGEKASTSG